MRIKLTVEYDGTNYCGWQRQKNGIAVQQVIEEKLCRLTNESITITGAGRTDAGVHAVGQTVHFDTNATIPPDKFSYALNSILPSDIRISKSEGVSDEFHARFGAKGKHYKYVIYNYPHASAVLGRYSMHVPKELCVEKMQKAAEFFKGTHDFIGFSSAGRQTKTTVRNLSGIKISKKDRVLELDFYGEGFLYNMVRIISGTLVYVGLGKISEKDIPKIIESKKRENAGITAPPQGLFLWEVYY